MTSSLQSASPQPDLHPVPRRGSEIQRRRPRDYTGALRATGNGVVTASAFIVILPVLFLHAMGLFGIPAVAVATLVACIWILSVIENASLWKNRPLREASENRLKAEHPELARCGVAFVGVSTPSFRFRQVLHSDMAHEDVGMLCLSPSALRFMGDAMQITIARTDITEIALRSNPFYAIAGIRWVRVSYSSGAERSELYIQSRERQRLSQLGPCNEALCERLNRWLTGSPALSAAPLAS
ncbi:MAG: hypothetical protein LC772_03320 [Chloroflexi bacterium]|nr:hypothetical protein [Chloroflexota bacterium]